MSETKSSTARIYLLFALLLGVVGFNSWFLLHNFESVRENQSWLTHTRVVITEIDSTALGVREAESAQRAYILKPFTLAWSMRRHIS
jgi:CHASE3 domain sensor protein